MIIGESSISWATSLLPSDRGADVRLIINRSEIQIRNIKIVFSGRFLLRSIGNLIETVAALFVDSVSKITSSCGVEMLERGTLYH